MVAKAKEELEQEMEEKEEQKAKYLEEKVPSAPVTGLSLEELKVDISVLIFVYTNSKFCKNKYTFLSV